MPCRTPSLYAGMTTPQLQAALSTAQTALVALNTGKQGVEFSYGSGDGVKTVKYLPTDRGALTLFIREMQAALGIIRSARPRQRFIYR
jgi:hypothetical protein